MRPWYKKWPSDYPPEYFLCSERARHVYDKLLDACGMREKHDGLAIVAETVLQIQTGIPAGKVRLALMELYRHSLIVKNEGSEWAVPFFSWMQRKVDNTLAERQSTFRERERDAQSNALDNAQGNAQGNADLPLCNGQSNGVSNGPRREEDNTESPVPSEPPTQPVRRARKKPDEAEWVPALRAAAESLRRRQLVELNADERFIVARYHGVLFAFLNRNESGNVKKAGGIATSLAYLIDTLERRRVEMTVAQYFALARKYHAKIGEAPWYTPTRVQAVMQVEAV